MTKIDEEVLWAIRGLQRRRIIVSLKPEFLPNQLRKDVNERYDLNISLPEFANHLRSFEERGLVECQAPSAPHNRLYRLTEKGARLQQQVRAKDL